MYSNYIGSPWLWVKHLLSLFCLTLPSSLRFLVSSRPRAPKSKIALPASRHNSHKTNVLSLARKLLYHLCAMLIHCAAFHPVPGRATTHRWYGLPLQESPLLTPSGKKASKAISFGGQRLAIAVIVAAKSNKPGAIGPGCGQREYKAGGGPGKFHRKVPLAIRTVSE